MEYKITICWNDNTQTKMVGAVDWCELTRLIDKCEAVWFRVELA